LLARARQKVARSRHGINPHDGDPELRELPGANYPDQLLSWIGGPAPAAAFIDHSGAPALCLRRARSDEPEPVFRFSR
jgi:hypothetical protein